MALTDVLFEPRNPVGSLARFVLDIYNGVIEGDARGALERIKVYRAFLEAAGFSQDGKLDPDRSDEAVKALQAAAEMGLIPKPLVNQGTVITGRFSAQTEWQKKGEGSLELTVGAVSCSLGYSSTYGRTQSEASEFTIHLGPAGGTAFSALTELLKTIPETSKALDTTKPPAGLTPADPPKP